MDKRIENYDYVRCPHCQNRIATECLELERDGAHTTHICDKCDNEIEITLSITAEFSAEKIE